MDLPQDPLAFGVTLTTAESARSTEALVGVRRPFAALFLGSTWSSRLWFAERFAAVADGLARRGLGTVLLGGADVTAMAADIVGMTRTPITNLVARTSLRDSYGILEQARLAVGPDSGPMHLAAAAGTPVVSLWGATTPARSAPVGSEDLVLVGRVPCAPCYLRRCPVGHRCMTAITVERVLARIDTVLEGQR